MTDKFRIAILKSESEADHLPWIEACEKKSEAVDFIVIDLICNNWLDDCLKQNFDIYLLRPPGRTELFKNLYDQRIRILSELLKKRVYPSLEEVMIYENKRYLNDWLNANSLPHPATYVFHRKNEAVDFNQNRVEYPIVAKTNIGASGNGVQILYDKSGTEAYINGAFSKGISIKTGPKIFKGSILKKFKKIFHEKGFIRRRISEYYETFASPQIGFVIFQEFIPHSFEWRCVRIGNSYFAHKKIAIKGKTSGTLKKEYGKVPFELLDFVKYVTDKTSLSSVAIDIFEFNSKFLINEIQCFFGQSDPYQMSIDGKPGRFIINKGEWVFEEGMFNTNQSYDLRLEHVIANISSGNENPYSFKRE
jgi:glutathione synthase/RimK-type ligase-like ATP-grasp enzyme